MKVYNSHSGPVDNRRRIGDFNTKIHQFKKELAPEELKEFRGKMFNKHGILI